MPKDSDKKVTIYVVHSTEDDYDDDDDDDYDDDDDEDHDDDDEEDDVIEEEDSEDDGVFIKKDNISHEKKTLGKIPISKKFHINRGEPITNLKSLIHAFNHPDADAGQKELVEILKEMDSMIGMEKFKEQIINQILFFIQDMHDSKTFLHTVITGPPGTGKTFAINTLAKIYCKLGILKSDKVVKADRSSLIGKWCGHTAIKTKEVIESARGGVLILDEVYSLGNKDHGDSFSKECIDTLNQYLSENVDDFVCIIAGYKDLVQECFFAANPGLERRFPWRLNIEPYTPDELTQIFKVQLNECGWKLDQDVTDKQICDLIKTNKECFNGNGGDTRNLIDKCKIINARRIFTMIIENEEPPTTKKCKEQTFPETQSNVDKNRKLSKNDLINAMKIFVDSKKDAKIELPDYAKSWYI